MTEIFSTVIIPVSKLKLKLILQDEINKVADWISNNQLSLSTAKTKFVLFRSSNKKPKHNISISLDDQQ